jgi:tetratricopeptide (TPR) repeat protein
MAIKESRPKLVPKELVDRADAAFCAWLRASDLTWPDIYEPQEWLSESTVKRIRRAKLDKQFDKWFPKLERLFRRFVAVAHTGGVVPITEQEVFGKWRCFTRTVDHPVADVSGQAAIQRKRLAILAGPLIDALLTEARYAGQMKNVWKASELLNHACRLLELTGGWEEASDHLVRLARLNAQTGDFDFQADALLRLGQSRYHAKNFPAAAEIFRSGLEVLKHRQDKSPPQRIVLRLNSYLAMASMKSDADRAHAILVDECLPLARANGWRAAEASVHNRIAVVDLSRNRLPDALKSILQATKIRFKLQLRSEAARSLLTLADIHTNLG